MDGSIDSHLSLVTSTLAPMDPPLSKNAQKKAARAARYEEYKIQRRAREKEARREKQRIRAEKRAAGQLDGNEEAEQARQKKRPRIQFGGRVVVDLGFDDLMNEKEIKSLCSQLAYTYSANRAASYPFSLIFTSLNGRTLQRLESLNQAGHKRWSKTEWWTGGYEQLWEVEPDGEGKPIDQPGTLPICSKENVIYLTADSEEELWELKPDETYIIGGIVDHNRCKNLCQNKAKESNIRTARLPIGRFLASLPTRKVLTVNQVLEILIKWVETKDWAAALNHVMPKRKFQAEGKRAKLKGNSAAAAAGGEGGKDENSNGSEDDLEGDSEKSKEEDKGLGDNDNETNGEEYQAGDG